MFFNMWSWIMSWFQEKWRGSKSLWICQSLNGPYFRSWGSKSIKSHVPHEAGAFSKVMLYCKGCLFCISHVIHRNETMRVIKHVPEQHVKFILIPVKWWPKPKQNQDTYYSKTWKHGVQLLILVQRTFLGTGYIKETICQRDKEENGRTRLCVVLQCRQKLKMFLFERVNLHSLTYFCYLPFFFQSMRSCIIRPVKKVHFVLIIIWQSSKFNFPLTSQALSHISGGHNLTTITSSREAR